MSTMRKTLTIVVTLIGLLGLTAVVAYAQDPDNGKLLWEENLCQNCHGEAGAGMWAGPLAGSDKTAEEWIAQVRSPRNRMPHFSAEKISDQMIIDMWAYLTSLTRPESFTPADAGLPADAPAGQQLLVEKRCVACHGTTGPMRGFEARGETPTAEAVITQLRTPRENMPMFTVEQVSDEEAGLIAEFMATQFAPQEQAPSLAPSPLEKAIAGVGGEEALQNLNGFAIEARGVRWVLDEGFTPGGEAGRIGPFQVQVNYDITGDALRLDYTLQSVGIERQVSEVIAGQLGYIDGQNANFGPPGISNMSSDRWASIRKHQRLLNPHLILRDVLAAPGIASEGGEVLYDGSVHHLLVVEDTVAPVTLYINAGTGHIAKLTTMENDALRRDVPLEVFYYSWQPMGGGLSFPAELYIAYDGHIVHKELRTAIEVNPELDSALFEFPAGASPVFDEGLAARGEAHHQYLQNFAALGFPRDGLQTQVNVEELAPGVFHLTGGSHHSLAVEQEDGIVIVEAPLDETRSQAVIDWVRTTFPDKPISYVVSSHHHVDHAGGLRAYVAEGIPVVMGEAAEPFFEETFLAGSTIVPDPLAENPVEATIEAVPADGAFTIADDTNSVEVYPIETTHAEDMVITYLPEAGIVFVVDIYNPDPNATDLPPGAVDLQTAITDLGLEVSTIVGGHGGTIPLAQFEDLLSQ